MGWPADLGVEGLKKVCIRAERAISAYGAGWIHALTHVQSRKTFLPHHCPRILTLSRFVRLVQYCCRRLFLSRQLPAQLVRVQCFLGSHTQRFHHAGVPRGGNKTRAQLDSIDAAYTYAFIHSKAAAAPADPGKLQWKWW